jgi:hypothetical protein
MDEKKIVQHWFLPIRVNQHPQMPHLAIMSIGWEMFFHLSLDLELTNIVP